MEKNCKTQLWDEKQHNALFLPSDKSITFIYVKKSNNNIKKETNITGRKVLKDKCYNASTLKETAIDLLSSKITKKTCRTVHQCDL